MVTVGDDYVELFRNWLVYSWPHLSRADVPLLVYAEAPDGRFDEVLQKLKEVKRDSQVPFDILDDGNIGDRETESLSASLLQVPFASDDYGVMMRQRPSRLLSLLSKGRDVLLSDIDTIWAKDPLPFFQDESVELYVTDNFPETHAFEEANGGFMFIRSTPRSRDVVKRWRDQIAKTGGNTNQGPFNQVLKQDQEISWSVLPRIHFVGGDHINYQLSMRAHLPVAERLFPSCVVYHESDIKGEAAKVRMLQLLGYWHPERSSGLGAIKAKMQ
eukprot:gnl/TRDRNA2_/TRDRNA2_35858_c0_seq1.p1 gnl/TRDRNA2_/TRDRNA2_35858_c0~~gnl/TRDRNA2_/TRDRNA2_35858_c0_seq1.p1  ORF type:complete len:315 (+),score=39.76 gnl/TRDRNA2_/TRDRNA2_35858_c0_seq1:130-945(+)